MNRLFVLHALMFLYGWTSIFGQISLSEMDIASSDSLEKSRILYFSPGKSGRNKVWDFSQKLSSDETSRVIFHKDSIGIVSIAGLGSVGYYRIDSDTVILHIEESPTDRRDYTIPKLTMKYPLVYGDSVTSTFTCDGMYCGNHPFREAGITTAKVDALGSLVLAERDTLKNVTRVHTVSSYSVCMDIDYAALDTAQIRQVIEERYEWYLPESQYPIIEDVISTTYYEMEPVATTKRAYCNLPEHQVSSYITPVDELIDNGQDDSFDEQQQEPDIIHYHIESGGGTIRMSYSLDEDATITIIVASHAGMLYQHREWSQNAGQYNSQIDCSGLRSGVYILYINVNGKAYSEKVTL